MKKTTSFLLLAAFCVISVGLFAQTATPDAAIKGASDAICKMTSSVQTLVYALGAVIGLIGAVRVYGKFQSGDQDTQKAAMGWFGAALFLILVGTTIKTFFGCGS